MERIQSKSIRKACGRLHCSRYHQGNGQGLGHGICGHYTPYDCPDCYTVADFCRDHPNGTYILAIEGHVVAVDHGDWYDTWDSGDEIPIYYWEKKNN